jgi:hypothetical protein
MAIIRKWLTPLELMPEDTRINPTTGELERTTDGGETWQPDPESDPRHNDTYRLPPTDAPDPKCDGAARIVAAFQDTLVIFQNSVNAAQFATAFMSLALALTPVAAVLAGVALLIFDVLIDVGQTAIEEAFTPTVWEDILCIIYCHIGDDGQISLEQRDAIMADIAAAYPGTIYNTLVNVVNLFGEVLMSNATVTRTNTGDCSECEECVAGCYEWNFEESDGGWFRRAADEGNYIPGVGWSANCITVGGIASRVVIQKNVPSPSTIWITKFECVVEYVPGNMSFSSEVRTIITRSFTGANGTGSVLDISEVLPKPIAAGTYETGWGEPGGAQPLSLEINTWSSNGNCSGSAIIKSARVEYFGADVYGDPNCIPTG